MASPQTICFAILTFISLVAANIIVIEQYDPTIDEYFCEPNEPCTIRCLSSSACAQSTLYCPARHDCDITCDPNIENGSSACLGSIIHAENSKHLSITVTPHLSNAQAMTIYAPYPHTMHNGHRQSMLTCHSSDTALHQCSDIQIYTTFGFNDIQLLCNDATSSCDISGAVKCGYNRYKDGGGYYHEIDECTLFQFENDDGNYQCVNRTFCANTYPQTTTTTTDNSSSVSNSSVSTTVSLISEILDVSTSLSPTVYSILSVSEIQVIDTGSDAGDIHALILVVAGTATVCCVVLIICAGCALIYIRFNRDHVEDVLLRRYLSGKGSTLPYADPEVGDVPSTEPTSHDEGSNGSSFVHSNDLELESEDSTDLGLTALHPDVTALDHHHNTYRNKYPGLVFEDELDEITNDININININQINNIHTDAHTKASDDEEEKVRLELHPTDHEIRSNVSVQNSSNHASINPEVSSQDSRVGESQDLSPRSDSRGFDKLSIHETGIALPSTLSYDATNSMERDGYRESHADDIELVEMESLGSIDIEKIPLPPPAVSIRRIGPDLTDEQLEQRAQTHLENIRNRSRCFGYIQADILYEEDENFSSDDSAVEEEEKGDKEEEKEEEEADENMEEDEKNETVVIHLVTDETDNEEEEEEEEEEEDEDENKSGDDCSESDDLLEDGVISIANEPIVIKLDSSVPSIPSPPVAPVRPVSSVPRIRHIARRSSSIPRVPSLPSSCPPERNDPEILSDDGQLPSLPMNESSVFH